MAPSNTRRSTQTQVFGVEPIVAEEPALPPQVAMDSEEPPRVETRSPAESWAKVGSVRQAFDWPKRSGADSKLPMEGDLVGGLYRLVKLIGEGTFGRVYVAERTDVPEHKVALKVVRRAVYAKRNVERELVMLAAASHPHIVQLKDHGTTDDYVWLTMPLLQGETLGERLERGTLTLREAFDIVLPIARGVEALHAAGLRHQDIKPDNIFLARFAGRVHPMLLDLGVAAEHNASFVAGTVMFAAPEQVMALGSLDDGHSLTAKLDTYCLASTLLRALVGPDHFPGENADTPFELASAFVEREATPLREGALVGLTGLPRSRLADAFRRWMAYVPEKRPDMGQLATELDVLLEQEREIDAEIERARARQKTSLQRVRIAAGGMLLVVLGASGLAYSKRETLRLAAALERAKAVEAESFDRLDTCVAAHRLSQRQVQRCEQEWGHDRDEFKTTLDALSETENRAQALLATRIVNYAVRLRTCEEDGRKASDAWSAEKEETDRTWQGERGRWEAEKAEWQSERAGLQRERDERATDLKSCQRSVHESAIGRDECREDLAGCIQDRDTCLSNHDDDASSRASPVATGSAKQPEARAAVAKPPESRPVESKSPARVTPSTPTTAVAAKPAAAPAQPSLPVPPSQPGKAPSAPPTTSTPPAAAPTAPATAPANSEPNPSAPPAPAVPPAPAPAPPIPTPA